MAARDRDVVAEELANDANEKTIKDEIDTAKSILGNLKILIANHHAASSVNDKAADAIKIATVKTQLHSLVDDIITPGG